MAKIHLWDETELMTQILPIIKLNMKVVNGKYVALMIYSLSGFVQKHPKPSKSHINFDH